MRSAWISLFLTLMDRSLHQENHRSDSHRLTCFSFVVHRPVTITEQQEVDWKHSGVSCGRILDAFALTCLIWRPVVITLMIRSSTGISD
jgi:hypothetical protein